jgi:hypothetical protein
MKQNYITINGTNYPVIFTLLTLSNFEEITNQGFFKANLDTTNNRMAIIVAAALAADKDTKLTIEELRGKDSWEDYVQISKAYAVIMKLSDDFFPIPDVEKGKDQKPEDQEEEGDKSKN